MVVVGERRSPPRRFVFVALAWRTYQAASSATSRTGAASPAAGTGSGPGEAAGGATRPPRRDGGGRRWHRARRPSGPGGAGAGSRRRPGGLHRAVAGVGLPVALVGGGEQRLERPGRPERVGTGEGGAPAPAVEAPAHDGRGHAAPGTLGQARPAVVVAFEARARRPALVRGAPAAHQTPPAPTVDCCTAATVRGAAVRALPLPRPGLRAHTGAPATVPLVCAEKSPLCALEAGGGSSPSPGIEETPRATREFVSARSEGLEPPTF